MKVSEVILPKTPFGDMLRKERLARMDMLKDRIQGYAELLAKPGTSMQRRDFLKSRIISDSRVLRQLAEQYAQPLSEAVHRLPLTDDDFTELKAVMERPIPALVAHIYLQDLIVDDQLASELDSLASTDAAADSRQLVADWMARVMPDQLYRFRDDNMESRYGELSPVHGYNADMYLGNMR